MHFFSQLSHIKQKLNSSKGNNNIAYMKSKVSYGFTALIIILSSKCGPCCNLDSQFDLKNHVFCLFARSLVDRKNIYIKFVWRGIYMYMMFTQMLQELTPCK